MFLVSFFLTKDIKNTIIFEHPAQGYILPSFVLFVICSCVIVIGSALSPVLQACPIFLEQSAGEVDLNIYISANHHLFIWKPLLFNKYLSTIFTVVLHNTFCAF